MPISESCAVLCVRSPRGGVPSSAGPVWHHGGTGHADGGESVRRTEESRGFRSDDHALVKQTFLSWRHAFALTSCLLVAYQNHATIVCVHYYV